MTILKLEPYSGISGDMFLGALAPLAEAEDLIVSLPKILGLGNEVSVEFTDVDKNSIRCRKAQVKILAEERSSHSQSDSHSHSHEHGHAHGHSHDHKHHHDHKVPHTHEHSHDDDDHHHLHEHRKLSDILKLINSAEALTTGAKVLARKIFQALGDAEASVHGLPIEEVHFHEVGALDSIIDIVGAAVLIDQLQITHTYCDPVCTGYGFTKTDHGLLAVPTPATEKLLHGMPTYKGAVESEMCTPTGAAILKVLAPIFTHTTLINTKSNFGAGDKIFPHPNALRASLCEEVKEKVSEDLLLIQTNIDDMPGELLGTHFQDQLLSLGALDVFLTPIIMKKGRPGVKLEVLCSSTVKTTLTNLILESTSSIGVRYIPVERYVLERTMETVTTPHGEITVKVSTLPNGKRRAIPEYEDCKKLANSLEIPLQEVYLSALRVYK